ncbi:phytochrome-like protein cph1 [Geobacter sp. OR-1]|uniref:sensor histidine kinase n=1 Tax=Geobacter sp. OR-1 TaxID=1266765 RepID=UPI000541AC5F|nr:ATP-binding protein [Geobacter sp. OR-1]GAM08125.1 phytochrome-like protein cph1 [Geobacter sp. OR-1]
MSIKTNMQIALLLVVSVLLATVGYMGWSTIRISNQLDRLMPSVVHLESIASARVGITRQMKEVVDCMVSKSATSQAEFDKISLATEEHFSRWESALRDKRDSSDFTDNEELKLLNQIRDNYREWHGLAVNVIEYCQRKEFGRAKAVLSETSYLVQENALLKGIDNALEDGNSKVVTEFHLLVMALGRLPWSNYKALRKLERVQSTVDSAVALSRINAGLSKQLKEVMDDLVSPVNSLRPFGWAGNETQTALNDFRRSARKLVELGLPESSKLLSQATTLENQYIKFTILCQQAMSSRQAGDVIKAAQLADIVVEQAMQEGLTPNLKESLNESNREIQELSSSVGWQGIGVVTVGAMLVLAALLASLRGILKTFALLERETSAIAAGNLDYRIDIPANTELGKLASSFNSMTDSLQRTDADLRELNAGLEQRVAERTAQLAMVNEDLRLFSSSVCHDLRSPLSSISGYSQLLLMTASDTLEPQTQEALQRIIASSEEMSEIIGALMKLARVTEDEISCEPVDLTLIASLVVAEIQERHPCRKVNVEIGKELHACGDGMLLKLVLENLIGNAWKFTSYKEDGAIKFDCSRDNGEAIYYVADNGAGFDMSMADSLFRPFGRLHRSEEFDGTGIGLATVKRIIDRHGGRIWATGEPGKGATFYFTLGS